MENQGPKKCYCVKKIVNGELVCICEGPVQLTKEMAESVFQAIIDAIRKK